MPAKRCSRSVATVGHGKVPMSNAMMAIMMAAMAVLQRVSLNAVAMGLSIVHPKNVMMEIKLMAMVARMHVRIRGAEILSKMAMNNVTEARVVRQHVKITYVETASSMPLLNNAMTGIKTIPITVRHPAK